MHTPTQTNLLAAVQRIRAMADTGLLYCTNEFDKERYTELREISSQLLGDAVGLTPAAIDHALPAPTDYPTPKVDVRGFILNENNEVLLVRESVDGRWTLPGGWCDIGYTPKEMVIKECREEAGIEVEPLRLLAVYDKKMHPHPPEPYYIYKLMFHCKAITFQLKPGHDVLDAGYFPLNALPPLSKVRILESQIRQLFQMIQSGDHLVYSD